MSASNEDVGIISSPKLYTSFVILNGLLVSTFLVLTVIVIIKASKELKFIAYFTVLSVLAAIGLRFMISIFLIIKNEDVLQTSIYETVQGITYSMFMGYLYFFTVEMYPLKIKLESQSPQICQQQLKELNRRKWQLFISYVVSSVFVTLASFLRTSENEKNKEIL